jgi:hypothetical protein
MQRRRKVLAVFGRQFPMAIEWAEVIARKIEAPYEQGVFKDNLGWARPVYPAPKQDTCAPANTYAMKRARASGVWGFGIEGHADASTGWKVPPSKRQKGFVKYRPGILPSVGDVFILYHGGSAHHCGLVCQASLAPDDFWITCDGGQPDRTGELHQRANGRWKRSYNRPDPDYPPDALADLEAKEAGYLVPRKLDCSDPFNPGISNFYVGGGNETLYGWRNLTADGVLMEKEEFDPPNTPEFDIRGTEADYLDMKRRILRVDELAKMEAEWRKKHYHPTEI